VGDIILGLPSSGLHTNGYSLVRKVFQIESGEGAASLHDLCLELGRSLGEELLEPHRCYFPLLRLALPHIKGMAHITGGGLIGNLPRVLPQGLAARLEAGAWAIPPIFPVIQQRGNVAREEMYRVFNMGVGMALICSPERASELTAELSEAQPIGQVVAGERKERVIIV
jgi:phosphoribosylformylglycinamidine cyclo-ligase